MKAKKTVPSPCISVCTMNDDSGYCIGCLRTIEEISGWERFSDPERRKVWDAIATRRAQHENGQSTHC